MSVRMRKKKNLLPRLEACASLMVDDAAAMKGKWRSLLKTERLSLEIGCGKGKFTCGTAMAHPEEGIIALERVPEAIVMAAEKSFAANLQNVRYIIGDAANLSAYFEDGELDRIYVNFCDPWPKKKQAKRRLVHGDFLKVYASLLSPEGEVFFKTDNRPLFDFALEQIEASAFRAENISYDLAASGMANITTEYEEKFMSLGTPINRVEMKKRK